MTAQEGRLRLNFLAEFFCQLLLGFLNVAEDFAGEDSGEDEGGSEEGTRAESLAEKDVGGESGEDRL
jgi:hypothetical protein